LTYKKIKKKKDNKEESTRKEEEITFALMLPSPQKIDSSGLQILRIDANKYEHMSLYRHGRDNLKE